MTDINKTKLQFCPSRWTPYQEQIATNSDAHLIPQTSNLRHLLFGLGILRPRVILCGAGAAIVESWAYSRSNRRCCVGGESSEKRYARSKGAKVLKPSRTLRGLGELSLSCFFLVLVLVLVLVLLLLKSISPIQ